MNTIHGASAAKPAEKRRAAAAAKGAQKHPKRGRKKAARRKVSRAAIAQPRTSVVAQLVGDMQAYLGELSRRRVALDAELTAITGALKAMGTKTSPATAGAPKRGRPPGRGTRPGSLKSFIVRVLRQRSRPMSPRDIATGVTKLGYKSKAKDLTKAVSNSLPELKSIKKVGFGLYKL